MIAALHGKQQLYVSRVQELPVVLSRCGDLLKSIEKNEGPYKSIPQDLHAKAVSQKKEFKEKFSPFIRRKKSFPESLRNYNNGLKPKPREFTFHDMR
jgi:hypothetical protein